MAETNTIHVEHFTIRANEVDASGNLTLPAICNFFQEVAGNNAKALNFDITDMHAKNMTWVVSRMDINIHKLPKWRENITIETWPASGDSFRAYRNYRLLNAEGEELCNCLSYWMIISLESRRPVRIPDEVLNTRLADRDHVTPVTNSRIRPFKEPESSKEIIVRRADMDMNEHVNNVRYLEWMLETISAKEARKIKKFDIAFLLETFVDARISSEHKKTEQGLLGFQIMNNEGKAIALAQASID